MVGNIAACINIAIGSPWCVVARVEGDIVIESAEAILRGSVASYENIVRDGKEPAVGIKAIACAATRTIAEVVIEQHIYRVGKVVDVCANAATAFIKDIILKDEVLVS